jgi:hypothetical protein
MSTIQYTYNFNFPSTTYLENQKEKIKDAVILTNSDNKTHTIAIDFLTEVENKKERLILNSFLPEESDRLENNYLNCVQKTKICLDIQPINGVSKSRFIKNLFRQSHVNDLKSQISYLASKSLPNSTKVFVLDVKDCRGLYENSEEISNSEKEVINFLKGDKPQEKSPRQEIHNLITTGDVEYVFLEGKLKNRVISMISTPQQAEFLQRSDRGKEILCMVCEIMMNLFKKGYDIQAPITSAENEVINYTFASEEFISPLKNEKHEYKQELEDISLITLYPKHYKSLYGKDEQYFKAISNTTRTTHEYDENTGTTAIYID